MGLVVSNARIHLEQNCRWQRPSALLLKSAESAVSNSEFRLILPLLSRHSFRFDISRFRFCTPPRPFCKPRSKSDGSDTFLPAEIFCAQPPVVLSRGFCVQLSVVHLQRSYRRSPLFPPREVDYWSRAHSDPLAFQLREWASELE